MELRQRLDAVIERALEEQRIVGTVVILSRKGKVVYRYAAGFADREARVLVEYDTIFRLASVTKPIVAATALTLVGMGKLKLDAPVTDYLPWFTPKTEAGTTPVIRIHHLLTHTSGLGYGGPAYEKAGIPGGMRDDNFSLEEVAHRLASVPLFFEPGSQWLYSMSIDVLGAVIAAVEGTTLGEAVARHVTGPLGMADTSFVVTDRARIATAYANIPGGAERMRPIHTMADPWGKNTTFATERIFNPKAFHSGGGGMAGTAPDFMRLLEALLAGGRPILSADLAAKAFTNQIGTVVRDNDPGEGFSYFGALLTDTKAAKSPCARGTVRWGGIYGNHWFVDPVAKLALVAFTNTAFEGSDGPFRNEIRNAIYDIG